MGAAECSSGHVPSKGDAVATCVLNITAGAMDPTTANCHFGQGGREYKMPSSGAETDPAGSNDRPTLADSIKNEDDNDSAAMAAAPGPIDSERRAQGPALQSGPGQQQQQQQQQNAGGQDLPTKTCVWCGASRTPMWRAGPAGPKTLVSSALLPSAAPSASAPLPSFARDTQACGCIRLGVFYPLSLPCKRTDDGIAAN